MTKEECAIVTIYTGVAMLEGDDLEYLYRYAEKLMERPVYTHELAMLSDELKERAKPDFIHLCRLASAQPKHNDISTSEQPKMDRLGVKTGETCTDTIGRQAAIDALHMHLMYRMGTDSNKKRLDDWINGLPSAQPEIITCTECKYYDTDTEQCNNDKGLRFIDFSNPERMWCPWAERREE